MALFERIGDKDREKKFNTEDIKNISKEVFNKEEKEKAVQDWKTHSAELEEKKKEILAR